MSGSPDGRKRIVPFDPAIHDRTAFSCGVRQVDNYFKNTANKLAKAGHVRVFVMVDAQDQVMGFYAINAHAVDYQDLPPSFARNRPGHGQIPAAFIAMIGRDRRFAKTGCGGDLLIDALRRIGSTAKQLGLSVVLLDVLDCGDPQRTARRLALYRDYGFIPLPSNPMRLFISIGTIAALFASDGQG